MKGNTLKAFLAIVFLFSITSTSHAELNAWTELSPGNVRNINSIVGGSGSSLYAGTNTGVYKYIYAENRWEPFGLQNKIILEIGIINHVLYTTDGKQLWRYNSGKRIWDEIAIPAPPGDELIVTISVGNGNVILGTNRGKVLAPTRADLRAWQTLDLRTQYPDLANQQMTVLINAIYQHEPNEMILIGTSKGLYVYGNPIRPNHDILPAANVKAITTFNNTLFVAYNTEVYAKDFDKPNFVKISDGLTFEPNASIMGLESYGDRLYLLVRIAFGQQPGRLHYLDGSTWQAFAPSLASAFGNINVIHLAPTKNGSLYIGNTSRIYEIHFAAQPEQPPTPSPTPPVPTPPLDTDGPDFGQNEPPPSEGKSSGCSLSILSTPGTSLLSWLTFMPLMLLGLGRLLYFRKK
ncbi:MAG: hypothetical protein HYU97_04685 [Deltaproteobacteria bacterium]|nr:hypothetical protein [Deltaproteobacteria bacterium]